MAYYLLYDNQGNPHDPKAGTWVKACREDDDRKVGKEATTEPTEITGYYSCKGVGGGNKEYECVAILRREGRNYKITFMMEDGNVSSGPAIRHGDTLSAAYLYNAKEGIVAVGVYHVRGKSLSGTWATAPGDGKSHVESMEFLRPLSPIQGE